MSFYKKYLKIKMKNAEFNRIWKESEWDRAVEQKKIREKIKKNKKE
ncbi:hypothetical protein [Paenisporosarcina sp. TG20]|nr:hypothetical protein [Paenisporosarcina sp. TG20]